MSASRLWLWAGRVFARVSLAMVLAAPADVAVAQQPPVPSAGDWQQTVRALAQQGKLDEALRTAEARLTGHPHDLEAHAWRGRVLAWKGRWKEAENEYRQVLQQAPDDVDILCALTDVLTWQEDWQAALETVDAARARSPSDPEVLLRRARILRSLGRTREARAQVREALLLDPENSRAKSELTSLRSEYTHELRFGNDVDTFNYTDTAQTQSITLKSRWNRRWSTVLASSCYQRFGQQAQRFTAASTFRISRADWLGVGGGGANHNGIVPSSEASFEYGHGFRVQNSWLRGLEASYQQRWLWYAGAHVLTLGVAQTYYLPREWRWSVSVTGARSGFSNTGVDWAPSGSTRLTFPLHPRLTGNLSFAVGSENYAQVDQIGRFSAQTFAGGLVFRFAANQDFSGYITRQNRSQDRSQTSYGVSYGIRF